MEAVICISYDWISSMSPEVAPVGNKLEGSERSYITVYLEI